METFYGKPLLTSQPASLTNGAGTVASFSGLARGSEPLTYQWYKNGVSVPNQGNIAGANSAFLQLSQVTKANEGSYRLVVSNSFGSVTSLVATLTVIDPFINEQPAGTNRNLGESVTFNVMAGGTPSLSYQWYHDGAEVPGAAGTLLTLQDLSRADTGLYTVVVSNTFGSITSAPALLTVNLATLDSTFNPGTGGTDDPSVYSLAAQADGKILVGGAFTVLSGQSRNHIGRLNADGTLDTTFNPGASGGNFPAVLSLAVQTDGKILVGGDFTTLGGQPRNRLGRLNTDGSVDTSFNPGATGGDFPMVNTLAGQPDGKILVGGHFTNLAGQPCDFIGRLNTNGTLDTAFDPGADWDVMSMALQTDGRILIGGAFLDVGGQARDGIARLQPDGTLDGTFYPGVGGPDFAAVLSLTVQPDGRIMVGGAFSSLGGQARNNIGRLNNTEPATQTLSQDGSTITWRRGGTSPEVWHTTFEHSINGVTWTDLGPGTRVSDGWQRTGALLLPTNGMLRARGYITAGSHDAGWFVESILYPDLPIHLTLIRTESSVNLNWTGGPGLFQVQQTTNLSNPNSWQNLGTPMTTNSITLPIGAGNQFLRVRSQ